MLSVVLVAVILVLVVIVVVVRQRCQRTRTGTETPSRKRPTPPDNAAVANPIFNSPMHAPMNHIEVGSLGPPRAPSYDTMQGFARDQYDNLGTGHVKYAGRDQYAKLCADRVKYAGHALTRGHGSSSAYEQPVSSYELINYEDMHSVVRGADSSA